MSPLIYSCTICGWMIYYGDEPTSWQNEYRGICTDSTDIFLTGVGLYDPDSDVYGFVAPRDTEGRWDDIGYASPEQDRFAAMALKPVDGRFGFILHSACWLLLQKAAHSESIPLRRWYDMCASLPIPSGQSTIDWGHTYGGYTVLDNTGYPWEDNVECSEDAESLEEEMSTEPYLNRKAESLVADACKQPFTSASSHPTTASSEIDRLGSLPLEIRIRIAVHLSTRDMLATRRASKAFWPILDSQPFWASRFSGREAERSWLFEVRGQKPTVNWRWLYRETSHLHLDLGLRNRKRIWDLVRQILPILELRWTEQSPAAAVERCKTDMQNCCWTEATADVHARRRGEFFKFHEGCQVLYRQQAALKNTVARVSVSSVRIGDTNHITGLELIDSKGGLVRLGYWNHHQPSLRHSIEVENLQGFNLAIGGRGLQALQCVLVDGTDSPWLASPAGVPQTRRLASLSSLVEIEAGFDGFKLVTLSAGEHRANTTKRKLKVNLAGMALWYPALPPTSLCMNDDSFLPRQTYMSGYKPLIWATFGGPGGIYLKHLTKITIHSRWTVDAICFSHDIEVPAEHQILGRRYFKDTATEFMIDGPGGELIGRVLVFQYQNLSDSPESTGGVVSGQLITNRGRCCCFGKVDITDPLMEVSVAPETTITGFYASDRFMDEGNGFVALGVISETVPRT